MKHVAKLIVAVIVIAILLHIFWADICTYAVDAMESIKIRAFEIVPQWLQDILK